ncbi:hypothetical protein PIB30_104321, partial [Stylosanthes scabra]|nr:hypothetical protein [Stylosanthes scabra]
SGRGLRSRPRISMRCYAYAWAYWLEVLDSRICVSGLLMSTHMRGTLISGNVLGD